MTTQFNGKSKEELSKILNRDLDPEKFEICVPRCSTLVYPDFREQCDWKDYVATLTCDNKLADGFEAKEGTTCDCKPGWMLYGDLAIAHAIRVHKQIHRQLLGFDRVSAVDVGFAIREREKQFDNFLAIRVHVNQKLPAELLIQKGMSNFSQAAHALHSILPKRKGRTPQIDIGDGFDPLQSATNCSSNPCLKDAPCQHLPRYRKLQEILNEECRETKGFLKNLGRYPVSGVSKEDLSIFCPDSTTETERLDDYRLCICGVPIDVVNARYNPSIGTHPGGDADRGVFVGPLQNSNELSNEEHELISRGRVNSLVGGVSVGTITGQAGTLGAVVWDRTDGTPCILSNWHVLAGTPTAQVQQPIYQPALFDGGTENDAVARLKRWHLGEEGDSALAELTPDRHYATGEVLGLWAPVSGVLDPKLNMEVRKWGRTTGFTDGFVDGIALATNIDYGGGVVRYFKDQFHIAPLVRGADVSQVGDSGSLVVTSFRPLEMHQHLATISGWLESCLNNLPSLRVDIADGIEALKNHPKLSDRCPKIETLIEALDISDICPESCAPTKLAEAIKTRFSDLIEDHTKKKESKKRLFDRIENQLDTLIEDTTNQKPCTPNSLSQKLQEKLEALTKKCPNVGKDIKAISDFLDETQAIIDRYNKSPSLKEDIARNMLKAFIKRLDEQLGGSRYSDKYEKIVFQSNNNISTDLYLLAQYTEEDLRKIKGCHEVCRDAIEKFTGWIRKVCDIVFCEALHKILHDLLEPSEEREDEINKLFPYGVNFRDPGAVIAYIENELTKLPRCPRHPETTKVVNTYFPCNLPCPEGSFATVYRDDLKALQYDPSSSENWFLQLLRHNLKDETLLDSIIQHGDEYRQRREQEDHQNATRVYYAVGMLFAGDTPGSPFGEFAVASQISRLADTLRFSMRPVFEPRSSFRQVRVRPQSTGSSSGALRGGRRLAPGEPGGSSAGGGPQPDPLQSNDDSSDG